MSAVHPISENPKLRIARLVQLLIERQTAARAFLEARERTSSPSEQIAYALDARLVMHPDTVAKNAADYPDWTPGGPRA